MNDNYFWKLLKSILIGLIGLAAILYLVCLLAGGG
jgi:hypothetical protein